MNETEVRQIVQAALDEAEADRDRRLLWAVFVAYVTVLIVGAVCIWWAGHVNAQSNQKWCGLVSTLDDAYSSARPVSEVGRRVAQEIKELRGQFGC